jgi:hypothetical protein
MTPSVWGADAAERLMSSMRRVPRPPAHRSPLEQEVVNLKEIALVHREEQPVALGDLGRSWFADVSVVVVDAVVARDKKALDALDELIGEVHRGVVIAQRDLPDADDNPAPADRLRSCESWVQVTTDYVRSALDRVAPVADAVAIRGTRRERFLRIVADQPGINSRTIGSLINADATSEDAAGQAPRPMDEGQLSKIGNALRVQGLVFAERGAQGLSWQLTPRGTELLGHLADPPAVAGGVAAGMLVTTRNVAEVDVAEAVITEKPSTVTFLRSRDTIKYQLMDHSERPPRRAGDGSIRAHAAPIDVVVKGLLDEHLSRAPSHFSIGDGLCYVQTGLSPANA